MNVRDKATAKTCHHQGGEIVIARIAIKFIEIARGSVFESLTMSFDYLWHLCHLFFDLARVCTMRCSRVGKRGESASRVCFKWPMWRHASKCPYHVLYFVVHIQDTSRIFFLAFNRKNTFPTDDLDWAYFLHGYLHCIFSSHHLPQYKQAYSWAIIYRDHLFWLGLCDWILPSQALVIMMKEVVDKGFILHISLYHGMRVEI